MFTLTIIESSSAQRLKANIKEYIVLFILERNLYTLTITKEHIHDHTNYDRNDGNKDRAQLSIHHWGFHKDYILFPIVNKHYFPTIR